mgnify:CR=1 FL=1
MSWKCYNLMEDISKMPSVAGVYAIYLNQKLIYIGSSNNLRNRFSGHSFRYSYGKTFITPWIEVPSSDTMIVKFKPTKKQGEWAMREIRLIQRLRPIFNTHHKGRKK